MATSSGRRNHTQKWEKHTRWLSGEGIFAVLIPCREISFFLWTTKGAADKANATSRSDGMWRRL